MNANKAIFSPFKQLHPVDGVFIPFTKDRRFPLIARVSACSNFAGCFLFWRDACKHRKPAKKRS